MLFKYNYISFRPLSASAQPGLLLIKNKNHTEIQKKNRNLFKVPVAAAAISAGY